MQQLDSFRRFRWFIVGLVVAFMPFQAQAATLSLLGSFSTAEIITDGPNGIAFDPTSGNLFVVSRNGEFESTVYELSTTGILIKSFTVPLDEVQGIDVLPNGNLLLSNSLPVENGGGLFEYTTDGDPVPGGLNLDIDPPSGDPDGVVLHTGTGTIFVADDNDRKVYEFDLDGDLISTISTTTYDPDFVEPEGMSFDPMTGNLLVLDNHAGTRSLYELTLAGALVNVTNLEDLTGFNDPEGMTLDAATRTLYVAFEGNDRVASFHLSPATVPEPGTMVLLSTGLVGLLGYGWRRRQ